MKRILLLVLILSLLLALPVQAAETNTWSVTASVDREGTARMSVRATLRMDTPVTRLVIPLGQGAGSLNVNGVSLRVRKVDGVPSAVLESDSGFTGIQVFNLTYTLTGCVTGENNWNLVLPLLADGLAYGIDRLDFQVTLPGATDALPTFTSGYYGEDVDNYMTVSVKDGVITGSVDTALRDRENLTLTMKTDPELFPRTNEAGRLFSWSMALALVCLVLGLAYWFLRLRWKLPRPAPQSQAPFGIGPGQIRSYLLTGGPDLALLVVSWAQAGYLTIHMNGEQTVTLHKRMDMGNERSAFEQRLFRSVFGHGQLAETSGRGFQSIRVKVDGSRLRLRGQFRRDSGNPLVLRMLGCAMGVLAGFGAGDVLVSSGSGRGLLLVLTAVCCGIASWLTQEAPRGLLTWDRRPLWLALPGAALLLMVGLLSGRLLMALLVCLYQLLVGFAVLFGGRRSEAGRQTVQSILGFRRYLRTMDKKTVNRIMVQNPGYYYDMAPFALALGVDRSFASGFEAVRLPPCPYLVTDVPQGSRAPEWYPLLRQVTQSIRGHVPRRPGGRVRYEDEL